MAVSHTRPDCYAGCVGPAGTTLVRSRGDFEADGAGAGESGFHGTVVKGLDYAQLDHCQSIYDRQRRAIPHALIFTTSVSIRYGFDFADRPSDPADRHRSQHASDGAMVRGGFQANAAFDVNYAVYFSSLVTTTTGRLKSLAEATRAFLSRKRASNLALPFNIACRACALIPLVFTQSGSLSRCHWRCVRNTSGQFRAAVTGQRPRTV